MEQSIVYSILFNLKSNKSIHMEHNIPKEEYEAIQQMIASTESVVGIDAKKTHIIIIHKLLEIEKRLDVLEKKQ